MISTNGITMQFGAKPLFENVSVKFGKGNRLGRGRGYYDRFLRQVPQAYKLGLCFGFQMTEIVPVGPTDVAMDEVLCG